VHRTATVPLAHTIKIPTASLTGRLLSGLLVQFGCYLAAGIVAIAAVLGLFRFALPAVVSSNSLLVMNAGVGLLAMLVWVNSALSARCVRSALRTG
jgi:uncharacterized membrane protein YGL010W